MPVDQMRRAIALPIADRITNEPRRNPRQIIGPVIVDIIAVRSTVVRNGSSGRANKDAQDGWRKKFQHENSPGFGAAYSTYYLPASLLLGFWLDEGTGFGKLRTSRAISRHVIKSV